MAGAFGAMADTKSFRPLKLPSPCRTCRYGWRPRHRRQCHAACQHDGFEPRHRGGGEHGLEQSRAQYRSDAGELPLRRKDPRRRIVPRAGDARQAALPQARRCTGIRRTEREQERAPAWTVHGESDCRAQADRGLVGGSAEVAEGDEMIGFRKAAAAIPAAFDKRNSHHT